VRNDRLYKDTDPNFQHMIGTRVSVVDGKGNLRIGILNFAGVNTKLHNQFQVTLSRCPIWPVDPKTIQPHPIKRMFD